MQMNSNRTAAQRLNHLWNVGAKQARYREDGKWYHPLTRFPAAFFDAKGYILFSTERAYRESPHLQFRKDVHIQPDGIASIPGYVDASRRLNDASDESPLSRQVESEITETLEAVLSRAQGFPLTAADRSAIENYAVRRAMAHFAEQEYTVTNVGSTRSYDVSCKKHGRELRVEVKGTMSLGERVILTLNEATLKGNRALFILHSVKMERGKPFGGIVRVISPWTIKQAHLKIISYIYSVPPEQ
jgi:hypothetical protein